MIARVLAKHPEVNLIFQPFNSTEVSKTQWQRWKVNEMHSLTASFIDNLLKGKVNHDYIQSDWFKNYSSSQQVQPKLNLIKDTKFHFKIDWLQHRFPAVTVYGIWRQPEEILHSLIRNGFHRTWYDYLTPEILKHAVASFESLSAYSSFIKDTLEDYEVMAIGVALRIEILLHFVSANNWLVYEEVISHPNLILNQFLSRFNLPPFDFSSAVQEDFNVAGTFSFERTSWKDFFSAAQQKKIEAIFQHLNNQVKPKSLIDG